MWAPHACAPAHGPARAHGWWVWSHRAALQVPQLYSCSPLLQLHPYGGHTSQLGLTYLGQEVAQGLLRGHSFVCSVLVG